MRLYFRYVGMFVRSAMQYRMDFAMTMLGQLLNTGISLLGIYLLFEKFGTLNGYSFSEVALCFAVINLSFSITECYARGFDVFSRLIKSGDFDRLLVRPRSLVLQVFGSSFELSRIGRMIFSLIVLLVALASIQVMWNTFRIIALVCMILGGVIIFTGIFIVGSTICFFTIEGLEIINIFTDGGRELAAYPLTIYPKWIMRFFTFIIPFGLVNYLPLLYITGRVDHPLYAILPLLSIFFLILSLVVWHRGARHYKSTGT